MKIKKIYSYLSYPSKHEEEQPVIGGATIAHGGRLYDMLKEIFDKSDKECNIPICFMPEEHGKHRHPVIRKMKQHEYDGLVVLLIKNSVF